MKTKGVALQRHPLRTQSPADVNHTGQLRVRQDTGSAARWEPAKAKGRFLAMGNTVPPRSNAQVPSPPLEAFGAEGRAEYPSTDCPEQITALLRGSRVAGNAVGEQVTLHELPTGDLTVAHAALGTLGRLAGINQQQRFCLSTFKYGAVLTEGNGNGLEVFFSRIGER